MLKIIFMGTPPIAATILEKLCKEGYTPSLVVTQTAKATGRGQKITPSAVELFASANGIQVISTDNVNISPSLDAIKALQPDLILVAAFGQILRDAILNLPKTACLNVHASLLPRYRGAAPYQRAIWNGDATSGITIQKMAKKLDTGDILLQKETAITSDETAGELLLRLSVLGGETLVEAIRLIESGKETFTPQNEEKASYAKKLEKSDSILDWNQAAGALFNQIRALQPWPTAETALKGTKLKIFKAQVTDGKKGNLPGSITTDGKSFLTVQCGNEGALSLTEIQLENRKRLKIAEFLLGFRGSFPYKKMDT